MNIEITWANYNGGTEDSVVVYRDESPIADSPIIPPLATLAAGATNYTDTTAVRGKMYYYRVAINKGSVSKMDKNRAIVAILPEDTGPGPQAFINGDWNMGFFGNVRSFEFITYAALMDVLNVVNGNAAVDKEWFKIAYKGKVLFIPKGIFRYNVSYQTIYSAGLVYGTNDDGLCVPQGVTPKNQYVPRVIKDKTFIPRLLQGLPNSTATLPATSTANTMLAVDPGSNEWDDITGAFNGSTARWGGDTKSSKPGLAHMRDEIGAFISNTQSVSDFCQQPTNFDKSLALLRGGRNCASGTVSPWFSGSALSGALNAAQVTVASGGFAGYGSTNIPVYGGWRPVLELVF